MFKRPGQSLMNLGKLIFWIILVISIFIGLAFAAESGGLSLVIFVLGGILVGYLSSISLYAFGSQVENTQKIAELLYSKEGKTMEEEVEVKFMYYCPKCHCMYSNDVKGAKMKCVDCKTTLYSTGLSREEWIKLSDEEKENLKAKWGESSQKK